MKVRSSLRDVSEARNFEEELVGLKMSAEPFMATLYSGAEFAAVLGAT